MYHYLMKSPVNGWRVEASHTTKAKADAEREFFGEGRVIKADTPEQAEAKANTKGSR